jgi:muramoyltetrapeptide carboxypeptidase
MKHIALSAISNPLNADQRKNTNQLIALLENQGIKTTCSKFIFESSPDSISNAKDKAFELHQFFESPNISAIFDISGGDAANLILKYLKWEIIAANPKPFFGISDNSVCRVILVARLSVDPISAVS